jgi:hypothetical protein
LLTLSTPSPNETRRFWLKNHRGADLISDALPFGRLWYDTLDNAIGYAMHSTRSHNAVIRVYDDAGNVIETHEHKGDFKEGCKRRQVKQKAAMR